MQKKIVALAVAGLSTAAFAQTNVTIYGVADVSVQGISASQSKSTTDAAGNVMALQSNSSLIGFKGTEDLGNGLKGLFQLETGLDLAGNQRGSDADAAVSVASNNGLFSSGMRDSFVGLNSKYGTVQAGYISTPFRSSLVSFAVEPGATGSMTIEKQMGTDPRRIAKIILDLDLSGNDWDELTKKKVIAAGKACPVARTLEGNVDLEFNIH